MALPVFLDVAAQGDTDRHGPGVPVRYVLCPSVEEPHATHPLDQLVHAVERSARAPAGHHQLAIHGPDTPFFLAPAGGIESMRGGEGCWPQVDAAASGILRLRDNRQFRSRAAFEEQRQFLRGILLRRGRPYAEHDGVLAAPVAGQEQRRRGGRGTGKSQDKNTSASKDNVRFIAVSQNGVRVLGCRLPLTFRLVCLLGIPYSLKVKHFSYQKMALMIPRVHSLEAAEARRFRRPATQDGTPRKSLTGNEYDIITRGNGPDADFSIPDARVVL